MMSNRIVEPLKKLFENHRIVFWYDSKKELREEFEAIDLPKVQKLEIRNNEFGLKYHVLRQEPERNFLLYHEGEQPPDLKNWLLDVLLAHAEFRTDQVAMYLSELDLGAEFRGLVTQHKDFFSSSKRREALKTAGISRDSERQIRLKMLAICAGADSRVDEIMQFLLGELAEEKEDRIKLIRRVGLEPFLWEQLARAYAYESEKPGIEDFHLRLFKDCFNLAYSQDSENSAGKNRMSLEIQVFLKRLKDARSFEAQFRELSEKAAVALDMEAVISACDFRELLEIDYFEVIDRKIIVDLIKEVSDRTASREDLESWIRIRKRSCFYARYQDVYEALDYASSFFQLLGLVDLSSRSMADAIQSYTQNWFQLDQAYRKFIYHVRKSEQASLMVDLTEKLENYYTNHYLLKLGNIFQEHVSGVTNWGAQPVKSQSQFFEEWVKPLIKQNIKVCVIISDAMRYEIGEELLRLIRKEDKYSAELNPALSSLPSYTQLGMASLLPHQKLMIQENDSGTVMVDSLSSLGTQNRAKILSKIEGATAMKAPDFMRLKLEDCRNLSRELQLLYLYHNQIDARGDKRETEGTVFQAAEDALSDLLKLIKKLNGANFSHILITADHGFLYQDRRIEESDFLTVSAKGEKIVMQDRRFVLGKGLVPQDSLHTFTSKQLGLDGDLEIQIPKSIHRLRLQGSGSRFVHGGATLQEVVIPVLKVYKSRQSDTSQVEVEILRGASSIITSGQLSVTFYQCMAVTDKVKPRFLRAGLYSKSGVLLSETHQVNFDLTSEKPREREMSLRFILTRSAEEFNGQEIFLRLEELVEGTTLYKDYRSQSYVLRRSFTSDFDF